ncbi:Myb-like DNA-binding domain containing protein [Tritrichomonas foetus]|uniref:Myb-like DNA-binding domain containing protein n=1 Tax=Tritrichomonas foetus TaxID=1144522 RepID=A0A1J4JGR7_9EUKA|nr:Myb-like DNA-binding domain containing protein [Tritrichomonas foetus]|eukprot:OHS96428.1 Myb-like DNA-binding domain containing protein [Tritrichomonas foetus]
MTHIPPPILVSSDTNTKSLKPQGNAQNGPSPWLDIDSPQINRKSPIVRVIKALQLPGRSVSTFPVVVKKPNAAPFPALPAKNQIQEQKLKVEQEIQCARAELSSLIHQRNFYDGTTHALIPSGTSTQGVKEYHNLLISDTIIESVIAANRERKQESESTTLAESADSRYKCINDLPLYHKTIGEAQEYIAPIFAAHFESRELIKQKQESLTKFYVESNIANKVLRDKVDEYNARVDSVSENWPEEFPKNQKTKTEDENELLRWVAPDQPMLMTKIRLMTNCYYNTNGFVPDPVAAHDSFRNRISWSEDERKKFVSKYIQHPKKFKLIADALPLKTVKDVIEFYYVNRYTLSLKEKEGARRKRGGKKKVISEGSTKTTK